MPPVIDYQRRLEKCKQWDSLSCSHPNVPQENMKRLLDYLSVLWEKFCKWIWNFFLSKLLDGIPEYNVVFFRDDAQFHLWSCVNRQNLRYWSATHSCELPERLFQSDKVTLRCARTAYIVIGPYFSEDDIGAFRTITSNRYIDVLRSYFKLFLNDPEDFEDEKIWFKQDGDAVNTTWKLMEVVPRMLDLVTSV